MPDSISTMASEPATRTMDADMDDHSMRFDMLSVTLRLRRYLILLHIPA